MNKKASNLLLLGFFIAFFILGYLALNQAMPEDKNEHIYSQLKPYLPYTIEKRIGGFTIIDKVTGNKEKPPASETFKYLDEVDKKWGKENLHINENTLEILNKDKEIIKQIPLNDKEKLWVKTFFKL